MVPKPPTSIKALATNSEQNVEALKTEWARASKELAGGLPTPKNHLTNILVLTISKAWLLEPKPSEAEMSRFFGVTPSTLRRTFVRVLGDTPPELDVDGFPVLIARIESELFARLLDPPGEGTSEEGIAAREA